MAGKVLVFLFFFSMSFVFLFNHPNNVLPVHEDYDFDMNIYTTYWSYSKDIDCASTGIKATWSPLLQADFDTNATSDICSARVLAQAGNPRIKTRCDFETVHNLYEAINDKHGYFFGTSVNMQFIIWLTTHIAASYYLFLVPNFGSSYDKGDEGSTAAKLKAGIAVAWLFWGLLCTIWMYSSDFYFKNTMPISNVIFGFVALIFSFAIQMLYVHEPIVDKQAKGDRMRKRGLHPDGTAMGTVVPNNVMNVSNFVASPVTTINANTILSAGDLSISQSDIFLDKNVVVYLILEMSVTFPLFCTTMIGVIWRTIPQWMLESILFRLYLVFACVFLVELMKKGVAKNQRKDGAILQAMSYFIFAMNVAIVLLYALVFTTIWHNLSYFLGNGAFIFGTSATFASIASIGIVTALVLMQFVFTTVEAITGQTFSKVSNKGGAGKTFKYNGQDISFRILLFWLLTALRVAIVSALIPYASWVGPLAGKDSAGTYLMPLA